MRVCSEPLMHSNGLELQSGAGEFFVPRTGRLTIPGSPQQTTRMPENPALLRRIASPERSFASRRNNKEGLPQVRF